MNSLEMVDEEIENFKNYINSQKQLLEKVNKEDMAYAYITSNIHSQEFKLEKLYKIRKDLEDYLIIKEIEEKVREGKMVIINDKKYSPCEFVLAEPGTIRHITIWYNNYKKILVFKDYKKTWEFEE